jgi:hypothetical protein
MPRITLKGSKALCAALVFFLQQLARSPVPTSYKDRVGAEQNCSKEAAEGEELWTSILLLYYSEQQLVKPKSCTVTIVSSGVDIVYKPPMQ